LFVTVGDGSPGWQILKLHSYKWYMTLGIFRGTVKGRTFLKRWARAMFQSSITAVRKHSLRKQFASLKHTLTFILTAWRGNARIMAYRVRIPLVASISSQVCVVLHKQRALQLAYHVKPWTMSFTDHASSQHHDHCATHSTLYDQ
jgi:hypothetical protein